MKPFGWLFQNWEQKVGPSFLKQSQKIMAFLDVLASNAENVGTTIWVGLKLTTTCLYNFELDGC